MVKIIKYVKLSLCLISLFWLVLYASDNKNLIDLKIQHTLTPWLAVAMDCVKSACLK